MRAQEPKRRSFEKRKNATVMRFIIRGAKKEEAGRKFARRFSAFSRDWLGGGIQRKKMNYEPPLGGKAIIHRRTSTITFELSVERGFGIGFFSVVGIILPLLPYRRYMFC